MKAYPCKFHFDPWNHHFKMTQETHELLAEFSASGGDWSRRLWEASHVAWAIGFALWKLTQPILTEGRRQDEYDGFTRWKVYPSGVTEDEIAEDFPYMDGFDSPYAGTMFAFPVHIRRGRTRTLVTQTGGRDI